MKKHRIETFSDGRKANIDLVKCTDLSFVQFMLDEHFKTINVYHIEFYILVMDKGYTNDPYSILSYILGLLKGYYFGYVIQSSGEDGEYFSVSFFSHVDMKSFTKRLNKVIYDAKQIYVDDLYDLYYQ